MFRTKKVITKEDIRGMPDHHILVTRNLGKLTLAHLREICPEDRCVTLSEYHKLKRRHLLLQNKYDNLKKRRR